MTIVDWIIIFVGGIVLFGLFTVLVINPINKTINDISSKDKE